MESFYLGWIWLGSLFPTTLYLLQKDLPAWRRTPTGSKENLFFLLMAVLNAYLLVTEATQATQAAQATQANPGFVTSEAYLGSSLWTDYYFAIELLRNFVLLGILWAAVWKDLTCRRIPNQLILTGLFLRLILLSGELLPTVSGGLQATEVRSVDTQQIGLFAALSLLILVILFFGRRWLGGGDAKLLLLILLYLGSGNFLLLLLLALVFAFFYAVVGLATGKLARQDTLPFAPFLLLAYGLPLLSPFGLDG